jgi:hypothetical protein
VVSVTTGPPIWQVTIKACNHVCILALLSKGLYVHCLAHSLNLSVLKSIRSAPIFTDALQLIDDLAIVTKQDRLNHLTVLHVHQDRLDAVNKLKVDFASANEYRRTVFGYKQLLL